MKKKDIQSMRQMKQEELVKAMSETKDKLAKMLIDRYSKQSKNIREGRELRKKIAIASTILREKEITHE
jgi:ribosomal protein L29